MIKVFQTIVDKGDGDCFRAAVASVLDLTIEQVPHFLRYKEKWHEMFFYFMKYFGWRYNGNHDIRAKRGILECDPINGYFLATVPSYTYRESGEGITHSVIMDLNGIIAHDPNPNKYYLGKTKEEAGVLLWSMWEKIK